MVFDIDMRACAKLKFLRRQWIWITLLILEVIIILVVRLTVLSKYEAPPGSDYGNHLSILNAIHGDDVTGLGLQFRYPPLYFLLVLDPLTRLLPIFVALEFSAALISSIIAIPFFFIIKKITKNNIIALFVAGLFAFVEGYSEMTCWGGIPNLLGIFFMLWSMYYVIDIEKISKRNAMLGGFFLSLIAGTHHLTFFYYIITLTLFILLFLVTKRSLAKGVIKGLSIIGITGALLSLPYLPFYVSLVGKSSILANYGAFATFQAIDINVLAFNLWYVFRYSSIFVWMAVSITGFLGVWKYHNGKFLAIFLSSFWLTSLPLSLFISDGRPIYFLYIPIFLGFSVFIHYLFKKRITRHLIKKKLLHTFCLIAFLTILTSSLVGGSYTRLVLLRDYYHVLTSDAVEALDWVKDNTKPGSFAITNDMRFAWWIEGYALRRCYMPAAREAFIYADQWPRAEIANTIVTGNHIIDNDRLKVADSFPAGDYNPRISVNYGNRYQDLLYLNDTYTSLMFSPDYNSSETVVAGLHSKAKDMQLNISSEAVVIEYIYALDYAMVTRTVMITHASLVIITYNVTTIGALMKGFEVPIAVSSDIYVKSYDTTGGNTIRLALMDIYNRGTYVNITVLETNGEIINVNFTPKDTHCLAPAFFFTFNKTFGSNFFVKFLVSVESKVYLEHSTIRYFDAYELIKAHNISYIFLNKELDVSQAYQLHRPGPEDVRRFASDPEHFGVVFQNDEVIIFKVLET